MDSEENYTQPGGEMKEQYQNINPKYWKQTNKKYYYSVTSSDILNIISSNTPALPLQA